MDFVARFRRPRHETKGTNRVARDEKHVTEQGPEGEALPARPVSLLQLSGRLRTIHFHLEPQLSCGNIEKCCTILAKLQDIDSQWLEIPFANTKDVIPSTVGGLRACGGFRFQAVSATENNDFT
jgi:hypothetical protein